MTSGGEIWQSEIWNSDEDDEVTKIRDENEEVFESTEDLIAKTKQSIESGFEKLGDIIKDNQKINAEDVLNPSNNK